MITKEELAQRIDGRQCPHAIQPQDEADAKEAGLLIVEGASDDLVEFYGAFRDETGCYEEAEILFDRQGLIGERPTDDASDDELLAWLLRKKIALTIEAFFGKPNTLSASWIFSTALPFATFRVREDDEVFCVGLVVDLKEGAA